MIKDSSMGGTPITTVNKRIMVPTARASNNYLKGVVVFVLAGMRAPSTNHVTKKGWCSYYPGRQMGGVNFDYFSIQGSTIPRGI